MLSRPSRGAPPFSHRRGGRRHLGGRRRQVLRHERAQVVLAGARHPPDLRAVFEGEEGRERLDGQRARAPRVALAVELGEAQGVGVAGVGGELGELRAWFFRWCYWVGEEGEGRAAKRVSVWRVSALPCSFGRRAASSSRRSCPRQKNARVLGASPLRTTDSRWARSSCRARTSCDGVLLLFWGTGGRAGVSGATTGGGPSANGRRPSSFPHQTSAALTRCSSR